ncbi:4-oxalocrotonate tautomerase [Paenibacillus sp. Soil766]|uniref:tautomerase family protein n=1 Tax=Paenibacillus sp. Soil766 TaxID=1736404 RepID=UPI00070D47A4|nr:tautomerase family protein [Paenibacillus sp. Soil766]KRF06898.1 4-oxalocrotonate tautomerase [Paenibacillus sp. Soil766]
MIIVHAPDAAFDLKARRAIVGELTDVALECETLPKSPFVKSTVWTYFNLYDQDTIFMGEEEATTNVVSVQIFVIEGGLDSDAKKRLIERATIIFGQQLGTSNLMPVYIIIHEVLEENWGIFGRKADLVAYRTSPIDAAAMVII